MPRSFFAAVPGSAAAVPGAQSTPLLILGASTRAAAQSAVRAGLTPRCGDLFADLDLQACAPVTEVTDYPAGFLEAAHAAAGTPWIYTGGLENYPELVDRISRLCPLWGNGPDVLARVRDPWRIAEVLGGAGLPALQITPRNAPPPPADGRWIRKPLRGAAGHGIQVWDQSSAVHQETLAADCYFQERRIGSSISAVCLARPDGALVLGLTQQLIGLPEVHAPEFGWCGNISPPDVTPAVQIQISSIVTALAAWSGLRGLFGCDFQLENGIPWLTEINPRYPASTELLEDVLQVPLLDWHRQACEIATGRTATCHASPPVRRPRASVVGKIVLYARATTTAPDWSRFIGQREAAGLRPDALPFVADIPIPGSPILAGLPVCTVFARGENQEACRTKLLRRAARLSALLF